MNCCKKCVLVISILTVFFTGYVYYKLTFIPPLPAIEVDKWWGSGLQNESYTSIRPFKIEFSSEMVTDLRSKLSKAPAFAPLEGVAFEYGFNNNYFQDVIKFWANNYNFKEREAFLNQYPQFKTKIQGLDIHYIHVKPKVAKDVKVLPLLLMHGWPGSVREFYEVIPLLTTPRKERDFVFEVIVPSLPGYGFSEATSKPGLGADHHAIILRNLMNRLGFKKYYALGGHFGAIIGHIMAVYFPEEVIGLYSNLVIIGTPLAVLLRLLGSLYPPLLIKENYEDRAYPLLDKMMFMIEELGYLHLQSTKPDTLAMALLDSPAALAVHLLEKFSTMTNKEFKKLPDGGLTKKFNLVSLLDNVMIYWITGSITSSMRSYADTFNLKFMELNILNQPITVPMAVVNCKHEVAYQPEMIMRLAYKKLIQVSYFNDGGHYAIYEMPETITDDFWIAVAKMREVAEISNDEL